MPAMASPSSVRMPPTAAAGTANCTTGMACSSNVPATICSSTDVPIVAAARPVRDDSVSRTVSITTVSPTRVTSPGSSRTVSSTSLTPIRLIRF